MSDTNRVVVRSVYESVPGETPSNPVLQSHCHTGINLVAGPQTTVSQKICGGDGRDIEDLVPLGFEPGGGWNFEATFGDQDRLFPGLFQRAWNQQNYRTNRESSTPQITAVTASTDAYTVTAGTAFAAGDIIRAMGFTNDANNRLFVAQSGSATTVVAPDGTVNETPPVTAELRRVGREAVTSDLELTTGGGTALISNGGMNFTTLGLTVGQRIFIGGDSDDNRFTQSAGESNRYARITGIAAARLDLDEVPDWFTDDDGSGKTIRIFLSDFIYNGVTEAPQTIQQAFLDHSPVDYRNFRGMNVDTLNYSLPPKQIATGSIGYIGRSIEDTTSQIAGASVVPNWPFDSMNTASNVAFIYEAGQALDTDNVVTNLDVSISNTSRRKDAVGVMGSHDIGSGRFNVTGTMTTYFGDALILAKITGNTESGLAWTLADADGHALTFDIPRLEFSDGDPDVPGVDQDVTLPAAFQGLKHADFGYTMSVSRFWCVNDAEAVSS